MSRLAARVTKLERSRGNGYVASRFLSGGPEMTVAITSGSGSRSWTRWSPPARSPSSNATRFFSEGSSRQMKCAAMPAKLGRSSCAKKLGNAFGADRLVQIRERR